MSQGVIDPNGRWGFCGWRQREQQVGGRSDFWLDCQGRLRLHLQFGKEDVSEKAGKHFSPFYTLGTIESEGEFQERIRQLEGQGAVTRPEVLHGKPGLRSVVLGDAGQCPGAREKRWKDVHSG